MSDIEELLGQVMVEHDDEAPRAGDLLRALAAAEAPAETRSWRRRRWLAARGPAERAGRPGWLIPTAAAIAVAAVMIGSAWAGGLIGGRNGTRTTIGQTTGLAGLSCPARYRGVAPWVPARPAGIGGRSRLAPLRTPVSAVVCGYIPDLRHKNLAGRVVGHVLTRQRQLTGGLAALAGDLAWLPRLLPGQPIPCLTVLGPQSNYLIGLAYRNGGRIWVSTTADLTGCVMTSNGDFTTFANVSAEAAKAVRTGRWPERPRVSCGSGGRLGQETVMVPAGSTSLTICVGRMVRTVTSGFQGLVAALNALPARTSTRECSTKPPFQGQNYRLEFAYPQGPAVQVRVSPSCYPAIDNLSLQAYSAKPSCPSLSRWCGLTARGRCRAPCVPLPPGADGSPSCHGHVWPCHSRVRTSRCQLAAGHVTARGSYLADRRLNRAAAHLVEAHQMSLYIDPRGTETEGW